MLCLVSLSTGGISTLLAEAPRAWLAGTIVGQEDASYRIRMQPNPAAAAVTVGCLCRC